ncbi:hypothetical protein NOVOSPHI9U_350048 [Novosphingobium sp. 9U]|nr:hypothetical protein NOVOSPHI9U_350048 [Novosphingobium sp. 9U]
MTIAMVRVATMCGFPALNGFTANKPLIDFVDT